MSIILNTYSIITIHISFLQSIMEDIKSQIAEIAEIDVSNAWHITDSDEDNGLYMINAKKDADMRLWGRIRGVVVDVKNRTIVARAPEHVSTATADQIKSEEYYSITDDLGEVFNFESDRTIVKMGFEGTLMMVMKHHGKVHVMSAHRIDPSRSTWQGRTATFTEIYDSLNGPKESLFSSNGEYSPYCHLFIMVHPDVVVASKVPVNNGFLVYIGPKLMWNSKDSNYPEDLVDNELLLPETVAVLNPDRTGPVIFSPPNLTVDEANNHLQYGFWSQVKIPRDSRLGTGEFVILSKVNERGETIGMLKVQSPAYTWRSDLLAGNPNRYNQFVQLYSVALPDIKTSMDATNFTNKVPILTVYSRQHIKGLIEEGDLIVWPQDPSKLPSVYKMKRDDRMRNIWQCLLVAVPMFRQMEVLDFLTKFEDDRTKVVRWLQELSKMETLTGMDDLPKRAIQIINSAKTGARNMIRQKRNYDNKTRRYISLDALVDKNIHNFVMKEKYAMYKLIKGESNYRRKQEEEKTKVEDLPSLPRVPVGGRLK